MLRHPRRFFFFFLDSTRVNVDVMAFKRLWQRGSYLQTDEQRFKAVSTGLKSVHHEAVWAEKGSVVLLVIR